jgi:hypothetical protein
MRGKILIRLLIAAAIVILAAPLAASAQGYYRDRSNDRYDSRDQYNRVDRRGAWEAINRLDNSSARLENDLNYTPGRRVMGIFELRTVDNSAVAQVRDFRRAVRRLRNIADNGRSLDRSTNEAQMVLDRGVELDRYLRLRTGSARVDADLSDLRSNLHTLADAFGLNVPY